MLTQRDWKDAIAVQNACNLSGVVYSWARVMVRIRQEAELSGEGTTWVNDHPINVMYASKVASLTDCESSNRFCAAYDCCRDNEIEEPKSA